MPLSFSNQDIAMSTKFKLFKRGEGHNKSRLFLPKLFVLILCIFIIQPTNIRFASGRDLVILDYNSCRHIPNKKAGAVVDVIGDTEFCGRSIWFLWGQCKVIDDLITVFSLIFWVFINETWFDLIWLLLFILITQARLSFRMMAVIYTDVCLHLECLPQVSRQPSLVSSAESHS